MVKRFILVIYMLLVSVHFAAAFETQGLKSGMSVEKARVVLGKSGSGSIEHWRHRIVVYPALAHDPLRILYFRKGSLYKYQERSLPNFAHFSKLVEDKRKALGKPADAWFEPAHAASTNDVNCIEFLWKNGKDACRLTYAQNDPDSWMTITYEANI